MHGPNPELILLTPVLVMSGTLLDFGDDPSPVDPTQVEVTASDPGLDPFDPFSGSSDTKVVNVGVLLVKLMRNVGQKPDQCRVNVCDVDPTLAPLWTDVSCDSHSLFLWGAKGYFCYFRKYEMQHPLVSRDKL